jgi:hypothetical protein
MLHGLRWPPGRAIASRNDSPRRFGVGAAKFGSWTSPNPIDRQLTSKAGLVTLGNMALDGTVKGE